MPKSTFYRLPPEKRENLLWAIRRELSRVPCDKASINKIVQEAAIPRGSFYQYFDDKDDMLSAVLEDYVARMGVYVDGLLAGGCDPFSLFSACLRETVRYGMAPENRDFLRNIFAYLRVQKCGYLKDLPLDISDGVVSGHLARIDRSSLAFQDDAHFNSLMLILSVCTKNAIASCFACPEATDELLLGFDRAMEIIKKGALRPVHKEEL